MPGTASATVNVEEAAGSLASGTDLLHVWAPVPENADITPRLYGSAQAVHEQHGYSEGVEFVALFAQRTGKPVVFIGLPIATPGAIGSEDTSGNTGSSTSYLVEGADGVLTEHDGVLRVLTGGTVGTDQIVLELSLDGGVTFRPVRVGTGTTYVVPYVGVTANLRAGTLVAGDVIHTWHGSGPLADSADFAAARVAMAEDDKLSRVTVLIGDVRTDTEAAALNSQVTAYDTENDRFLFARCSVGPDRLPPPAMSHVAARMTGTPELTFAEVGLSGDTLTRATGSWLTDGFAVGDTVVIDTPLNPMTAVIATLSATVMTFGAEDVDAETTTDATVIGYPTLTFAEVGLTGDTITRNRGSWLDDGFRIGTVFEVEGSALNDDTYTAANVTATVITLGAEDLEAEIVSTEEVTAIGTLSKAAWMAALATEFEDIDDMPLISLGAGRGAVENPFTGWHFRRSPSWAAVCREYTHDLHVTAWRKEDGPIGFSLKDASDLAVEWDDRIDGGAGNANRFTVFRTWGNGPRGAFLAGSFTRAQDGQLRIHTSNTAIVNLAETVIQLETENVVGRTLELNADFTATEASLRAIELQVNSRLEAELLSDTQGEGKRASSCVWTASREDLYNQAENTMNGTCVIVLNGIVFHVNTTLKVAK